jgi:hypothetical protein
VGWDSPAVNPITASSIVVLRVVILLFASAAARSDGRRRTLSVRASVAIAEARLLRP